MPKGDKKLNNLKPFTSDRSSEEAARNGRKGGIASGVARRKKKKTADILTSLLDLPVKSERLTKTLTDIGAKVDKNTDVETAMMAGLVAQACNGRVDAIEKVLELKSEAEGGGEEYPPVKIPAELMVGVYSNLNRHISNGITREAIIKGGRGGWKSSYPGLKIPELIMANPSMHALCLRNVKDTLKDSVFEQLKWGIDKLGVSDRFKFTTSPLKVVYKPTGQTIYFRGADDPIKIKSIKPPFGYIGIVWFEEFDQYAGEAAIRNMRQSAIRGTDENGESRSIIFETFNPPPTAQAWANQYVADIEGRANDPEKAKKGTEILHTCYTDVPREWLGEEFIQEADDLKRNNPRAYENEYEGKVTGTGGNVFENLEIRDITDEEVKNFDKAKQGLDWGYFPDPTAFVKLQYDPAKMVIYVFDEKKRIKTGNEELIDILKDYKYTQTIADNAEEKSIAFFRSNGYNIRPCVKGPGSVDFGIKWLASRSKIVIDRKRCPETAKEFEMYEYMKDKDGNFISGYPDENNHFIDAVRYALNDEIMRSKAALKQVRY
jgi:PBSX family phage terminase large subunit